MIYKNEIYPVTIQGKTVFEIPVGTKLYSDEVEIALEAETELEVRIYYKNKFADTNSIEEEAVLYEGNATFSKDATPLPKKKYITQYGVYTSIPTIDSIEMACEEQQKTIVAFGDSITAMNRWMKPLAKRIYDAYGSKYTVVNSGICGNCMIYEAPGFFFKSFGEMGSHRYKKDVLDIPGVNIVILAFGINDISFMESKTANKVNIDILIGETTNLAKKLQEKGIRVVCQTLGPRKGYQRFTEEMEQIRQQYNAWVRSCNIFDYVVDVEPYLLEEGTTDTYKSGMHQGDFLHPNKEGGQVMAKSYDLFLLTGEECVRK